MNKKTQSCQDCSRKATTEWSCLGGEDLVWLDEHKSSADLSAGSVIYSQGEKSQGVYCLQSGLIGLRRTDADGNSVIVRLVHPGETIGYRAFLRSKAHDLSAEALMPSRFCIISTSSLRNLLQKRPELGVRFLDHSMKDAAEAERHLLSNSIWKVNVRVLHFIIVMFQRYGVPIGNGGLLILPLSRKDMASLLGVTPETLSRSIHSIQKDELASFDQRNVEIPNIERIINAVPTIG